LGVRVPPDLFLKRRGERQAGDFQTSYFSEPKKRTI
jgi:hypothetical protein